jgi:hypothetical protein
VDDHPASERPPAAEDPTPEPAPGTDLPTGPGWGAPPGAEPPPPPPPAPPWAPAAWGGQPPWAPPGWGQGPTAYPPPGAGEPPRGGGRRGRNRALVAGVIAGALVLAAAVGVPSYLLARGSGTTTPPSTATPGANPTPTPSSQALTLYNQVMAAANQSAGFRYVAVSDQGGQLAQTITGDAGQHDGTQEITVTPVYSAYGTEQFSLRLLTNGLVYFQGNVPALEDQLGVTAATAPSLTGTWIQVGSRDGPYSVLEPGITVGSQLGEDIFAPTSTRQVQSGGRTVTRISGSAQGFPASLDVPLGSKLPATFAESGSNQTGTFTLSCTFSAWGTAPTVSAPSGAVAWSTLSTVQPPNGYGGGATPAPGATPTPTPTPGGSA